MTIIFPRFVLALHSDHFKNAFFGSGVNFKEKEEGSVVIKDTTKEAFEDFLGFNYEKKIDFGSKTLEELYEVFNLAERYQVEELKEVVSTSIKNFPLSIDNVVKSAAIAKEYGQLATTACLKWKKRFLAGGFPIFLGRWLDQTFF